MGRIAKKSGAYHHGDLRRVLLGAAVRVVEKEGVAALSLHALSQKAGVSSGAPYHHFESREQLLAAIAVEGYELLATAMKLGADEAEASPRAGETTAEAHLRGLGHGYVRFALEHPGHFRVMFRPELKAQLSVEQHTAGRESFEMLGRAIAQCQEERTIPSGDPNRLVLLAWSAVHGASVLWIDGPLSEEQLVPGGAAELGAAIADTLAAVLRRGA